MKVPLLRNMPARPMSGRSATPINKQRQLHPASCTGQKLGNSNVSRLRTAGILALKRTP
jgi:hypothetical protein